MTEGPNGLLDKSARQIYARTAMWLYWLGHAADEPAVNGSRWSKVVNDCAQRLTVGSAQSDSYASCYAHMFRPVSPSHTELAPLP